MFHLKLNTLVALALIVIVSPSMANAQVVYSYQLVPQTIFEKKPVTVTRWIDETVMEKQQVTSYKAVWQTETRQRRHVSYKPVQKTSEREERVVSYKPVVETLFRENRIEETTYETVTEYRDEEYIVREPVIETEMREEKYTVRKPVTENLIEVQSVTTFKPVLKPQTQLVPMVAQVDSLLAVPNTTQRARLMRLDAGYYMDPATGTFVYRRRGMHWVQPTLAVPAASLVPSLVPQQTSRVEFVPETVETRKPVEVTRYVETVLTRKVPIQVERMVERVETRRVPVTYRKPVTKVTIERVPYTRTTYKEEVVVKKVPYTETIYQEVVTVEPYDVKVLKWLPETREIEVPKTVRRRVDYEVMQDVPRTVLMKVPLDICGNPLATAMPVYDPVYVQPSTTVTAPSTRSSELSSGYGTTLTRRVDPGLGSERAVTESEESPPARYKGKMELVRPKTVEETSGRTKPVLVPESSKTELQKLGRPEGDSEIKKTLDETSDRTQKENPTGDPVDGSGDAAAGGNGNAPNGDESNTDIVPNVEMPEFEPSQTGDENAAERSSDLGPPE